MNNVLIIIDPYLFLDFYSKTYEKVMANFLTNFLDANDLLYNSQFGFRHNRSTSHAIITLIEKISRALDTGKIVCGIFNDFRKAFDVIPHKTDLTEEIVCIWDTWRNIPLVQKLSFRQVPICTIPKF